MADALNVLGGDTDPLSPKPTPGAQALNAGIDQDTLDRQQTRAQQQELFELQKKTMAERHDIEAGREREEGAQRRDLMSSLQQQSETARGATAAYLQQQKDIPEFKQPDLRGDAFLWMSIAAGFGAIAGGLSRYHTTAALNAFGATLQGWSKGNLQAFEQNYQTWETNAKRAQEYNARAVREYKAIMDNQQIDVDTKANMLKLTASKWDDKLMSNAADARDLQQMSNIINAQSRQGDNFATQMLKIQTGKQMLDKKLDDDLAKHGLMRDENGKVIEDPSNPVNISDEALDTMVERRILGDKSVMQNLGRGTQGARNIAKFNQRLAQTMARRGLTGQDIVTADQAYAGGQSYQVAAGRYASRVESATNELQRAIPLAEKASKAFDRGDWVPWNTLINQYKQQTSDPKYNDFIVKALAARNAYVRAMNPTGNPRIAERVELQADKILDAAIGKEAFSTQLRGMWQEAQTSRRAIAATRGLPVPELEDYPEQGAAAAAGGGGGGEGAGGPQDLGGGWKVRQ